MPQPRDNYWPPATDATVAAKARFNLAQNPCPPTYLSAASAAAHKAASVASPPVPAAEAAPPVPLPVPSGRKPHSRRRCSLQPKEHSQNWLWLRTMMESQLSSASLAFLGCSIQIPLESCPSSACSLPELPLDFGLWASGTRPGS